VVVVVVVVVVDGSPRRQGTIEKKYLAVVMRG
jgi:hypothetical protein